MLLRKEEVEMRAETGFGPWFWSPPRFDRMLGRLRHMVREGISRSGRPSYGIAPGNAQGSAHDGKHHPAPGSAARPRRVFLMEDMADLLARAVLYVLSMLGLLYALDLIAVAR
jgi:hypothetical protein